MKTTAWMHELEISGLKFSGFHFLTVKTRVQRQTTNPNSYFSETMGYLIRNINPGHVRNKCSFIFANFRFHSLRIPVNSKYIQPNSCHIFLFPVNKCSLRSCVLKCSQIRGKSTKI